MKKFHIKLSLRLNVRQHEQLKIMAESQNLTCTEFIRYRLFGDETTPQVAIYDALWR